MYYLWSISDKHKLQFLELLEEEMQILYDKKVNAQLVYNHNRLRLDYLDKPLDARIFLEDEDTFISITRNYKKICSAKNYFMKQLVFEGNVFSKLPEDILCSVVGYMYLISILQLCCMPYGLY